MRVTLELFGKLQRFVGPAEVDARPGVLPEIDHLLVIVGEVKLS